MNEDLPTYAPVAGATSESQYRAPTPSLAQATCSTSALSLLVGGFLVVAITVSNARGDADEWGIGPFFFGVGLVLIALAAAAMKTASLGRRAERETAKRSPWSVLGMTLAIIAAVPSGLIVMLLSTR